MLKGKIENVKDFICDHPVEIVVTIAVCGAGLMGFKFGEEYTMQRLQQRLDSINSVNFIRAVDPTTKTATNIVEIV